MPTSVAIVLPFELKVEPSPIALKPGAKAKPEVKKDAEPNIPGTTIARPNGTFLGLELDGNKFKLSFYDKKKKPVDPDVSHATARWPDPRGPRNLFCLLAPSGKALVGNKPVVPPFNFQVTFNLFQNEDEKATAVETYVVPFRG